MSILPRKLTFQLTPLLDLLLIVIFAQYMEVRETAAAKQAEWDQRAEARLAADRDRYDRRSAELHREQALLDDERAALQAAERRRLEREAGLREDLQAALERQQRIGDVVAELFQVPADLIDEMLQPRDPSTRSAEELEALRTAFRDLARRRGTEAVKHLLTYEELRKRCDIWELYISAEGMVTFDAGTRTARFRFREPEDADSDRTRDEIERQDAQAARTFADKLFETYKTLPQTKGVVIMLLSYSGMTSYNWRRPAILGLSSVADRMRADSNGDTRFEYAILGPVEPPSADQGRP